MNTKSTIKIMTLNAESGMQNTMGYYQYATSLWKSFLPHSTDALIEIAELIKKESIDLATFTEVDGGSFTTKGENQIKTLSKLSKLDDSVFFPTYNPFGIVNQGNGICSRYPLLNSKKHKLVGNGQPRYLGIANIRLGEKDLTVMVTHLALGRSTRKEQIEDITNRITKINGPIIFTGDLNTEDFSEIDLLSTKGGLICLQNEKTYPSWKPAKGLDKIFYSPEIKLLHSYVLTNSKVSDHLPLIAEFSL